MCEECLLFGFNVLVKVEIPTFRRFLQLTLMLNESHVAQR